MENSPEKNSSATARNAVSLKWVYDFDRVVDIEELKRMIAFINRHCYVIVSVTQDKKGVYTIFFRRPIQ